MRRLRGGWGEEGAAGPTYAGAPPLPREGRGQKERMGREEEEVARRHRPAQLRRRAAREGRCRLAAAAALPPPREGRGQKERMGREEEEEGGGGREEEEEVARRHRPAQPRRRLP